MYRNHDAASARAEANDDEQRFLHIGGVPGATWTLDGIRETQLLELTDQLVAVAGKGEVALASRYYLD